MFRVVITCLWVLIGVGCSAKAAEVRRLTKRDLNAASVSAEGIWESTPWRGTPWVTFTGGVRLTLEHTLGRTPRWIQSYLSFNAEGTGAAMAAGDLSRITFVNEEEITIENGTKQDYFIRVVLR